MRKLGAGGMRVGFQFSGLRWSGEKRPSGRPFPQALASLDGRDGGSNPTQGMGHARMPRGSARQERRVVWDDHTVEAVPVEDLKHT
jgi:hypothetical protein